MTPSLFDGTKHCRGVLLARRSVMARTQRRKDKNKKKPPPRSRSEGTVGVERDPKLNNPDATPGTGMLPPIGDDDSNMQPSS
jgi:hypothetical protein